MKLVLAFLLLAPLAASANPSALLDEIRAHEIANEVTIGLTAIHLPTGETVQLNGNQSFPMASTYKVPMAAYAFHLVEQKQLAVDQMIPVLLEDYVSSSRLADAFPHPGLEVSLLNLIEPMLIYSDNTATDVVLRTVGGGEAVTAWLTSVGINDMRVDRNTADLIRDYLGVDPPEDRTISARKQFSDLDDASPGDPDEASQRAMYQRLINDPRDQSTPLAMATLIAQIWSGELLNEIHRNYLKEIMLRCRTGANRLSARLPPQALPIAHKTGTLGGTANDVGVIDLGERGEVVIVAYAQKSHGWSSADRIGSERAIAETARSVYDYFRLR